MNYSRLRAWARHWRLHVWWWGLLLLAAVSVRECSRNEALPGAGPIENT